MSEDAASAKGVVSVPRLYLCGVGTDVMAGEQTFGSHWWRKVLLLIVGCSRSCVAPCLEGGKAGGLLSAMNLLGNHNAKSRRCPAGSPDTNHTRSCFHNNWKGQDPIRMWL